MSTRIIRQRCKRPAPWLLALALIPCATARSQQTSPWQGEWGAIQPGGRFPSEFFGRSLSLFDCHGSECHASIDTRSAEGVGSLDDKILQIVTINTAEVKAEAESGEACTLQLRLGGTSGAPVIHVHAAGPNCGYWTSGVKRPFEGDYPLVGRVTFAGQFARQCYVDHTASVQALCRDGALDKMEEEWETDTRELAATQGGDLHVPQTKMFATCDATADAAGCLRTRFANDKVKATAEKARILEANTAPGDAVIAARKIAQLVGRYSHSFRNGDVQGDSFRSTDTLTIKRVDAMTISFDTHLEFYNGHECNLGGEASFRKDGTFVFDDVPENADPDGSVCRLAIIPGKTGLSFNDITGACKNYCGMRGGWTGEGFAYRENIGRRPAPAKPAKK